MAVKSLKSIKFPGLPDTYIFLQDDTTLTQSGKAADSKVVGDALSSQSVEIAAIKTAFAAMGLVIYNGQFYVNPDGNTLSA